MAHFQHQNQEMPQTWKKCECFLFDKVLPLVDAFKHFICSFETMAVSNDLNGFHNGGEIMPATRFCHRRWRSAGTAAEIEGNPRTLSSKLFFRLPFVRARKTSWPSPPRVWTRLLPPRRSEIQRFEELSDHPDFRPATFPTKSISCSCDPTRAIVGNSKQTSSTSPSPSPRPPQTNGAEDQAEATNF